MSSVTKTRVGFGAALAIIVCVAALSYLNILQADESRTAMVHTQQVLDGLDHLLLDLVDAETGERGFLATGSEVYLEPYLAATNRIHEDVHIVRELTHDNPGQQGALDRLEPAIDAKLRELADQIQQLRQKPEGLRQLVAGGVGKASMDDLRVQLSEMSSIERSLLEDRAESALHSAHRAQQVILIGNFLAISVVGYFA